MSVHRPAKRQLVFYCKVIALLILLALITTTCLSIHNRWKAINQDRLAESDFRRLKAALFSAIADRNKPRKIILWQQSGPAVLAYPLEKTRLSEDITANVFHHTRRRRNSRPTTITRIEVKHKESPTIFTFTEVNGVTHEQKTREDS